MITHIRKVLLLTVSAFALLLVLLALVLVVEHFRGKSMLANYRKALVANGEKITAAELSTTVDEAKNGAPALWKAAQSLGTNKVWMYTPGAMRTDDAGQPIAAFRRDEWKEEDTTYTWAQFEEALALDATPLEEAREALQLPFFESHLNYAMGPALPLPHLSKCKSLAQRFGTAAQVALRKGDNSQAADYLVAQIRTPHALERDHLLISELVRIACASIARSYTWEALQADGWTDSQLARFSAEWEQLEFTLAMAGAMEGERVFTTETFRQMRQSNAKTVQYLYWMEDSGFGFGLTDNVPTSWWTRPGPLQSVRRFLRNEVYCRAWRFAWLDQSQARYMKSLEEIIQALRAAAQHKSHQTLQAAANGISDKSARHTVYDKLVVPEESWAEPLVRSLTKPMRVETERSLVLAAIALKRYAARNHAYPKTLEALVPDFLKVVPVDFMDGKPLRYALRENVPILYSVGDDGIDDGGDSSLREGQTGSRNIWNRRDFVWPMHAKDSQR